MALVYQANGSLIHGIHTILWTDFVKEFGFNAYRMTIIAGLYIALNELKACGCKTIYIDGSFATQKELPSDFDACWDPTGVDLRKLVTNYPTLVDFANGRANQKRKYLGELFPANIPADINTGELYFNFFQHDKMNNPKGIIEMHI